MIRLVLLLLLAASWLRADDAVTWSKEVNGLKARIVIPASQDLSSDPFLRVYLELQSTQNVLANRKVYAPVSSFTPQLVDESGKLIPSEGTAYDGFTNSPKFVILPFDSLLRMRVNQHGTGFPPGTTGVLDFGPSYSWFLHPGSVCYLAGTFTAQRHEHDSEAESWWGTIDLPRVRVPTR